MSIGVDLLHKKPTEIHSENHIVFTKQAERGRDWLELYVYFEYERHGIES